MGLEHKASHLLDDWSTHSATAVGLTLLNDSRFRGLGCELDNSTMVLNLTATVAKIKKLKAKTWGLGGSVVGRAHCLAEEPRLQLQAI